MALYGYYNVVSRNGGYFASSSAQADTNIQPQANQTTVVTSASISSANVKFSAASAEPQTAAIEEATEINANATATTTAKQAATTSTINNTTAPENGWNSDHTAFYQSGKLANGYVQADDGNYYMFKDGIRQKGVQKWMGTYYYFDPTTYLRVDNNYRE